MKEVLSIVLAIVVGLIFVKLLLSVLSIAFAALSFFLKAALIAIFALPVYIIFRRSFKKK